MNAKKKKKKPAQCQQKAPPTEAIKNVKDP